MQKLIDLLTEKGCPVAPTLDGVLQRFNWHSHSSQDGWFIGREITVGEKSAITAVFGSWKSGEKHTFSTPLDDWNPEERRKFFETAKEMEATANHEKGVRQGEARSKAQTNWLRFSDRGESPYLSRKKLTGLHGCKLMQLSDGGIVTIVPVWNGGELVGLQYIQADGKKNFGSGTRLEGSYYWLGTPPDPNYEGEIYVSEGIATAASVVEAVGKPTVAAFNAGNLGPVAAMLRKSYRSASLVIAGDNDRNTPGNPGRSAAKEAARVCQGSARIPYFPDSDSTGTDWNDLHIGCGLQTLRDQLLGPDLPPSDHRGDDAGSAQGGTAPADLAGLPQLDWPINAKGQEKPPTDQKVADALLDFYGDRIVKDGEDLFIYIGTHWKHVQTPDRDLIYQQIQYLYRGQAGIRKIEAIFQLFCVNVEHAPVPMFLYIPERANFRNGTLHALTSPDGSYRLEFLPHNKKDFLTHILPIDFDPTRTAKNEPFTQMVERVFQGDSDADQKIQAVKEAYGACLMPLWPHLFLFHGPAASGKSSLIIPAMRLIHKDNWCRIGPNDFSGFNLETMAGKAVNIVTDINLTKKMEDDMVKQIEDRSPIDCPRKFKTAVSARLPAIHLFGANGIPRTSDGNSGAHDRRWTFIEVSSFDATKVGYRKFYADWVYEQGPQGILNFAMDGLESLIRQRGIYTDPESGIKEKQRWQTDSDPVKSFLRDIEAKEFDQDSQVIVVPTAKIKRLKLYKIFSDWATEVGFRSTPMTRNRFYDLMGKQGYRTIVVDGYSHFSGIGVTAGPESHF